MEQNFFHIVNCIKRYLLVFAVGVLVLLTSCVVKASIKSWTGVATQSEQGLPKNSRNATFSSPEICAQIEVLEGSYLYNSQFDGSHSHVPLILFCAIYLALFGIFALPKEITHPLYRTSSKIRSALPLFLEYRRLILPFTS